MRHPKTGQRLKADLDSLGHISDRPDPLEAFAHMHAKYSYHVVGLI
jgi:hypothetical protein